LKQLLPDAIQLIDPALGVARQLDAVLGVPRSTPGDTLELGQCRFCVTADPDGFANRATPWLGARPEVHMQRLQS
jgi:glutamate racemase